MHKDHTAELGAALSTGNAPLIHPLHELARELCLSAPADPDEQKDPALVGQE